MTETKPGSGAGSTATIFVVDDELMLLDLALAEFSKSKPAVLVTDYAMGAMNGLDLIRECRRIQPRQKSLLVSGTVDENIYADADAKPDAFLAKPYQVREFIELVKTLAGG